MKRLLTLSSVLFLIPVAVAAQQFSNDDNAAKMQLGNDIYTAGNFLNVTESVPDDLFIAGNQITVQADVGGDVLAAGSNLTINGAVGDDVRIAGGNVTVNGTIGGDLLLAGGTVYVGPDAVIEGNLLLGGGMVRIEGTIRGNAKVSGEDIVYLGTSTGTADLRGENITLRGSVGGNAIAAAKKLTIDPAARIGGELRYWSRSGVQEIGASVAGTSVYDEALKMREPVSEEEPTSAGVVGILGIISLFALFSAALSIAVFQFSTRTFIIDSAMRLRTGPGMSVLWGLIFFLLTPIVILLLMITIIGLPLALAVAACYFLTLLFAQILTAMVLARWAEKQWSTKKKPWHPVAVYFAALGIWILLKFLWVIPFLGWIIVVLAVFAGFGAVLSVKWERFKQVA